MKIIAGLLILISVVSAIDFGRRRHGRNRHGKRHHHHHRAELDKDYDNDKDKDKDKDNYNDNYNGHGYTIHKTCRSSGMVALTFDDGVV